MHFNHINIRAELALLKQEKIFFCEVLGLQEDFRPAFPNRGFWIYEDGKPIIHLTESVVSASDRGQGHIDHLAFEASGLETFLQQLNRKKVDYKTNYTNEVESTQVLIVSPLGIKVEIIFKNEPLNE